METAVRIATTDDSDFLVGLLEEAIERTPVARRGDIYRHRHRAVSVRERVASFHSSSAASAFVGSIDDVVVGFALVSIDVDLALIEELYVEPDARGVGIGEGLLEAAINWARARGCHGIDIDVLPGDRPMKNACERAGLVARTITMHKEMNDLEPTSPSE